MPPQDRTNRDMVVIEGTAPRVAPPRPRGLRKPPGKQSIHPSQESPRPQRS